MRRRTAVDVTCDGTGDHLLHTRISRHKLVEVAKRQAVGVAHVFQVDLGLEERVVHTDDSVHPQQVVLQDEVVVVDVVVLVGVDEHHVKLVSRSGQFLPGDGDSVIRLRKTLHDCIQSA